MEAVLARWEMTNIGDSDGDEIFRRPARTQWGRAAQSASGMKHHNVYNSLSAINSH